MSLGDKWFTEICEEAGSAFSLKVNRKLHEEQTPFQRIAIYETTDFGKLMVIDGFVMLADRDNFIYHEMMSHPALFTHPDPRSVLVIGGGDCGTLREVLKHPGVERALQVEIDERVTRLAEQYFPKLCEAQNDPRASLHFGDGIQWAKEAAAGSYDLIVIDSTDPVGPAKGLFTEAFYRDCLRALTRDGLLVQQSESPLYHLESILLPMHQAMRAAGFASTVSLHFPQCVYPSGWWTATMARRDGPLTEFREQDAANRSFETLYYNPAVHTAALAQPEFMRRKLARMTDSLRGPSLGL